MALKRFLFSQFYRLRIAPWEGHPIGESLATLIAELSPRRALEIGCGTGDNCIYLAKHGWAATGVDFVDRAIAKARVKAAAAGAQATFVQADVTSLDSAGIGADYDLIVDYWCLHGMTGADREAYVREVTAVAAPTAKLYILAFRPGAVVGVPGIEPAEVTKLFAGNWNLLKSAVETTKSRRGQIPAHSYLFDRTP
jgi:SAM-dependent methyltransferase